MRNLIGRNVIAGKLILAFFLVSGILAIGSTSWELWTEYKRDVDAIEQRLMEIELSYLNTIVTNVWDADTESLNVFLSGIIELPDFILAEIRADDGKVIMRLGQDNEADVLRKSFPLYYTFQGEPQFIGKFNIVASLAQVETRTWDRVWVLLLVNGVKVIMLVLFMFAIVNWLITRHLHSMALHMEDFDITTKPDLLILSRGSFAGGEDELDELAKSFNSMRSKLFASYEAIGQFNQVLEQRVEQRTSELSAEMAARQLASKDLVKSESRLRDIAEAGSDWMWEMDADLRFSYISNTEGLGPFTTDDVIGRKRDEFLAEDTPKEVMIAHLDTLEKHLPFRDFKYTARNKRSEAIHLRVSGKPIFDAKGTFKGYRGIGTNITTQVNAERVAEQAQQRLNILSAAIEQNPSGVFITDRDGVIEYVNAKFTELTGYEPIEVLGKNPRIIKSDDTPPEVHKSLWKTISQGREWRGELKDMHKNGGSFWAHVIIAPVKGKDGIITHYIASHEDISKRKSDEKKLQIVSAQAQVANRAKTEIMANMSHELRTPLNAIIGFSDTIIHQVLGPMKHEKYESYVQDINDSGKHLLELINDILDISAIEAGKLELQSEPLALEPIAQSCMRFLHHQAVSGNVEIDLNIQKDLPNLLADERRIKQVILNLLSNGLKFTPEGGKVTIDIGTRKGGGISIAVTDTGIGMDDAGIELALSQFGQVESSMSRQYRGTGLGLPLSKSLVEAHRAKFKISSALGEGTKVEALFPPERSVIEKNQN